MLVVYLHLKKNYACRLFKSIGYWVLQKCNTYILEIGLFNLLYMGLYANLWVCYYFIII